LQKREHQVFKLAFMIEAINLLHGIFISIVLAMTSF